MAREMIHSGIEWIGEIPKEWRVELIGNNIKEIKDKNEDSSEDNALQFKMGSIISKKGGDSKYNPESLTAYTKVQEGDIVINGLNLSFDFISQRVGLVREKGVITSTYLTLRPSSLLYGDFVNYLFKAYDNCKAFHGMGRGLRQILSFRELRNQKLIYPSLAEQQKIANYLDKVCGEVDEMIALQEQMIEELKAYKQSVITEAVTKGLNSDVPMKESGIDWIGEVPDHWEVKKIGYVFYNLDYLREPISAELRERNDPQYDYYGASGVIDKIDHYNVEDKVLLIGEDGANLVMRNLPLIYKAEGKFWVNNHAHILKPIKDDYNYMAHTLEAADYRNYITGFAQPKLSQENLKAVKLPVPPLSEQQSIASYLDTKCAEIDALIAIKQAKIDELKEYKKSIIYEYVTGKKEVV